MATAVSYSQQFEGAQPGAGAGTAGAAGGADAAQDPNRVRARFREFIRGYREVSSQTFPYRAQLLERWRRGEARLVVELEHLNHYDEQLLDLLLRQPRVYLHAFELAARDALMQTMPRQEQEQEQHIQVLLSSRQTPMAMRHMSANEVNQLLLVPGIVTAAHRAESNATMVCGMCDKCQHKVHLPVPGIMDSVQLPRRCSTEDCDGRDSYKIVPDESTFEDLQRLKLQEAPEAVPAGEMPRSVLLTVTRSLVDTVAPGARVKVMGIWTVNKGRLKEKAGKGGPVGGAHIKQSFLHVVGIQTMDDEAARGHVQFTPAEEQRFLTLARSPDIYGRIAASIAPAISGDYAQDLKKAVACLLFGGTRRLLPDGMRLRGDVNVLMLGDPSTAKSQLLKFAERAAPVGVYTSGKGSSAAGLTANVVKDSRGEFYLEGGAMVLADGGVVCIDEFDKMREQDRVAIHEAMEQQTISVAKAGITTVLNSRSSVLAAANPVFGTYNDMKSAAENIDFLPTILSRFDLIFIVRDHRDEAKDRTIARHVIGVHVEAASAAGRSSATSGAGGAPEREARADASDSGELDLLTLKRYVQYARVKCAPVLSAAAAELLRNHYVGVREDHRRRHREAKGKGAPVVPITVRQLEAVVRLSEALAKMELAHEATPEHVAEAIRLFKVSTLSAASTNAGAADLASLAPEQQEKVRQIEEMISRRVPVGDSISMQSLMDWCEAAQGFDVHLVRRALFVLLKRGSFAHSNQQKMLRRVR